MGGSAYLGCRDTGHGGTDAGASRAPCGASAPILDTCVTTSQRRKLGRLYTRMGELEFLTPDLLRSACFLTLTSAKAETADTVRRAWHRTQAELMRHGYTRYLVTSAIQSKRFQKYGDAVVHYHCIVLGHARVPVGLIRKTWRIGATYHETAKTPTHAIRYIASYMRGNSGRLSWSYELLRALPAGARPHSNCFRYVRSDPLNGFDGGVIDFGWGNVRKLDERYSYVPALGRVVPSLATSCPTLLWIAYRLTIDWLGVRERLRESMRAENEFIDRLRRGDISRSARYPLDLGRDSA